MALDPINSAIFNIADMIGLNSKSAKPAEVGFNLNEFKAAIAKNQGIAKTSTFLVNIIPNFHNHLNVNQKASITRASLQSTGQLTFFCSATNLPGLTLETSSTRRYGIGPEFKIPVSFSYPNLNLVFYGDNNGNVLKYFTFWLNNIVLHNTQYPLNSDNIIPEGDPFIKGLNVTPVNFREGPGSGKTGTAPFEFKYPSETSCIIEISMFDPDARRFETRTFLDAYPVAVGDVRLSWADHDTFMTIPVQINYSRYYTTYDYPPTSKGVAGDLTLLQKLIKVGTVAQTLSTVKKPRSVADMINLTNNASIAGGGLRGLF